MLYSKPAITYEEQLDKLTKRGLEIDDYPLAIHYLKHVGYYRLAGYWWPLQSDKEKHSFKAEAKFSTVLELYNFDRELRILLFKAIEKVEISLRTKLIYHLSHEYDPWWFQDTKLFSDSQALIKTLASMQEEVERSKDVFIREHRKKYKEDKRFPPSWKTLELTSFGSLSKLYGNLRPTVKSKDIIADEYLAVNHTYLPSWLQSFTQIRNFCAHHSRLWNKNLPGSVKLLTSPPGRWIADIPKQHEQSKLYVHMCLLKYILNVIHPDNQFTSHLDSLFLKYPIVDENALGMKSNWRNELLWQEN